MKILMFLLPFIYLVTGKVDKKQRLAELGFDFNRYDAGTVENAFATTIELATKFGYKAETYTVTTSDDYILKIHRIQSKTPTEKRKAPIFLMHGFLGTSNGFVAPGPKYGLACVLADMGYDVWMGNGRGNLYSRKHKTLNPDGDHFERGKYWSHSWHEIGIYDLPAMINKTLEITGAEKLHYIGYSQGTTCFWVMASELPEYNKKIIAMQAFAPGAFTSNADNNYFKKLKPFAAFSGLLDIGSKILGFYEIPANSDLLLKSGLNECDNKVDKEKYDCAEKVHLTKMGYNNTEQINTKLPVVVLHSVGGSSTKSVIHYSHLINSGRFCKFDYGLGNLFTYGSSIPPDYKLKNISTPIALYYGNSDGMVSVKDVDILADTLPTVFDKYLVSDPKFNHHDFIFSANIEDLLHKRLFTNLKYAETNYLEK